MNGRPIDAADFSAGDVQVGMTVANFGTVLEKRQEGVFVVFRTISTAPSLIDGVIRRVHLQMIKHSTEPVTVIL